jgi:hypothetical protein
MRVHQGDKSDRENEQPCLLFESSQVCSIPDIITTSSLTCAAVAHGLGLLTSFATCALAGVVSVVPK